MYYSSASTEADWVIAYFVVFTILFLYRLMVTFMPILYTLSNSFVLSLNLMAFYIGITVFYGFYLKDFFDNQKQIKQIDYHLW